MAFDILIRHGGEVADNGSHRPACDAVKAVPALPQIGVQRIRIPRDRRLRGGVDGEGMPAFGIAACERLAGLSQRRARYAAYGRRRNGRCLLPDKRPDSILHSWEGSGVKGPLRRNIIFHAASRGTNVERKGQVVRTGRRVHRRPRHQIGIERAVVVVRRLA